jgi:hypothetical protein
MTIDAYRRALRARYRLVFIEAFLGLAPSPILRRAMALAPADR